MYLLEDLLYAKTEERILNLIEYLFNLYLDR